MDDFDNKNIFSFSNLKNKKVLWGIIVVLIILVIIFSIFSTEDNKSSDVDKSQNNVNGLNTSTENNLPQSTIYYSYTNFTTEGMNSVTGAIQSDGKNARNIVGDIGSIQYFDGYIYGIKDSSVYKFKSDFKDGESNSYINITGSTTDNFVNKYNMYNGKVYYSKDNSNASDDVFAKLASINSDGTNLNIINEYIPSQILADKDGLFEVSMDAITERKILKFDLDGKNKITFESGSAAYINIAGDYIYYTNIEDNFNLYRIKKDGTSKNKILDNSLNYNTNTSYQSNGKTFFDVIDDYVYYININDGNKLYKVKTDGTDNKIIIDKNISKIFINKGYIYIVINYGTDSGVYVYDNNGKELNKIFDKYVESIWVE
ncbi:MAG: DUF5050 domain-containing protein [Clostridia bacterium]|nr:DUF5050 domain-containing protein [Clostridia bacterium]MDD4387034.1 DUF5050 domain-containing protein [Clostridia bacterium]